MISRSKMVCGINFGKKLKVQTSLNMRLNIGLKR